MTKPGFLKKIGRLFQGSEPSAEQNEFTASTDTSAPTTPQVNHPVSQQKQTQAPPPPEPIQYHAPTEPLPPSTVKRTDPAAMTPEPARQPSLEEIAYNSGLEVKVVARGGTLNYAICPKCEAMWNIKDRLSVILQKRLDKSLTCAACEEMVSLPKSLNLRKL